MTAPQRDHNYADYVYSLKISTSRLSCIYSGVSMVSGFVLNVTS